MTARTGLGLLEVAVLEAVDAVGGKAGRKHKPSTRVLEHLEGGPMMIGPRYAYEVVRDITASWRVHLPLLEGYGNWGSPVGDPSADAQYTATRLSRIGELALAAERGSVGPVPLGIIEGSMYRGGSVPPFAPEAVMTALQDGRSDAGPPVFPTGGVVSGDIDGLLQGRPVEVELTSVIVAEEDALVITRMPYGVTMSTVVQYLRGRRADRWGSRGTPLANIFDESSSRGGTRIVCRLAPGVDPADAVDWVRSMWPVSVRLKCRLPAAMRRLLGDWDRGDGSGLSSLAALL